MPNSERQIRPPLLRAPPQLLDGRTLSLFIRRTFGVKMVRQCCRIMHDLGFRYRKPRLMMAGSSPREKNNFKKPGWLEKDASMELWALDEAKFDLHGTAGRGGGLSPEVVDPEALMRPTKKSVGYFSTVHLAEAAQARRKGKKRVVIMDKVKYHYAALFKTGSGRRRTKSRPHSSRRTALT